MEVRPLKQKSGSYNCVAVVAAMASGCLPEDFKNRWKHEAPYCDIEFIVFMTELGYGVAMGSSELPRDFNPEKQLLTIQFDFEKWAAFIAVESDTNPELTHAVLWDGKQIYDPNPHVPNGRSLDDYKILKIFPFTLKPEEDE